MTGEPVAGGVLNRASYDRIAPLWDGARTSFSGREEHYLERLLDGVDAPARVLDLGCGTGRPMAEWIVGRGHRVVGVDQSEAMLARARERFPESRWVHARIETFDTPERFHAALLWDSMFHVERDEHARILENARRMLLPGGRLMCTVGGSANPAFTDTMFGERFFYDSHPPEEAVAILHGLGFRIVVGEFMNLPTGGRDRGRYAIVAERSAGAM